MTSPVVLDELDPSIELACVLVGLHHDEQLDAEGRIAAVAGWERLISWATAMLGEQLLAIEQDADVARWGWHAADAARSLADQLGLALGVSGGSAARRLTTAATLIDKTPAVHDALRVGALTVHHARVAASAAAHLPTAVAQQAAVATMVDGQGDTWRTPMQFADTLARHVLELDPDGTADRNRAARRDRRVTRRSEPDGMRCLRALLAAEDADAVHDRLDACARSSLVQNVDGDERTLDHRRADALVQQLVTGQLDNGYRRDGGGTEAGTPASQPTRHGRHATVQVTVSWSTLIGLDDLDGRAGLLAGFGPIDAATARRIAADPTSTWYRLLTDPATGQLLDHGRTRYRPPQDLQDFVMARDRCCPQGVTQPRGVNASPPPATSTTAPPGTQAAPPAPTACAAACSNTKAAGPTGRPRHRRQRLDRPPRAPPPPAGDHPADPRTRRRTRRRRACPAAGTHPDRVRGAAVLRWRDVLYRAAVLAVAEPYMVERWTTGRPTEVAMARRSSTSMT